jgi:tetratricopeptide (TPR) repeat protein
LQANKKIMSEEIVETHQEGNSIEKFLNNPDYKKKVYYAVIGIVLAIAGFLAYRQTVLVPRGQEAYERMFVAEYYFGIDSLDLALNGQPGGFDGFLTIIDEYSGTNAANLAHLYAGLIYLHKRDFQEAISYLENYKGNDAIVAPSVLGCIGDAYSEMNDLESAANYYAKAASKKTNSYVTPRFLRKEALVRLELGEDAKALTLFTRLRDEFYFTTEGREAERMVARLELSAAN